MDVRAVALFQKGEEVGCDKRAFLCDLKTHLELSYCGCELRDRETNAWTNKRD
jgi:hypothetical protein